MNTDDHFTYPVIDVSHDYGRTFSVNKSLKPAHDHNWGDADYLAVGSNGTLYVAWDYGPSNSEVRSKCSPKGSCWATNGDLNVVVQSSTDEAKTFTPISVVNPGYPDGGADEGDVTVSDDGDTFGISTFSTTSLVLSWGSAVPGSDDKDSVFAPPVEVLRR